MRFLESGVLLLIVLTGSAPAEEPSAPAELDRHNVVWTSPSKDSAGSMPLGNGQVGINLWVEEGGDLRFYIARSDSLSEISRLLKVGAVRVSLSPNPFPAGRFFRQELRLRDGVCEITAGEGERKIVLRVFVDAERPVVHVTGESASPVAVKAAVECWRTQRRAVLGEEQNSAWTMHAAPFDLFESADVFPTVPGDAVVWYHRNETSVVSQTIQHQGLESAANKVRDPLLHRTFGGWMTGAGFRPTGHAMTTSAPVKSFALCIATPCEQTPTAKAWIDLAGKSATDSADAQQAVRRTAAWWQAFWGRSWIFVNGDKETALPGGKHPLRVGYDSQGGNKFPGQLGRVGVYRRPLSADEIARLAAAARSEPPPIKQDLLIPGGRTTREIAHDRLDFSQGFTLEAWVQPDGLRVGRIFDKITAGGGDGFLFDVYPKDTLRLIVGSRVLPLPAGTLKGGRWQHVAATLDAESGGTAVYLDGKQVAGWPAEYSSSPVTRGYTLQRYVQACGGRGSYPIKFNGGIFTVEPKPFGKPYNPDWRAWGDCHWWQNVRHTVHPMLASGDFEMMDPLFRLYGSVRPLCEARAAIYHGARGCYFPETMTVWGTYSNGDYGWNRTGHQPKEVLCPWWANAWNQGPEIVGLLLDRWDYTGDEAFLKEQVLPMAESVLAYFDTRFKKDAQGKIIVSPTQAVETYWTDVVNDTPTIAGLKDICARLCALPETLAGPDRRSLFAKMKAACPRVPIEEEEHGGKKVRELAPAEKYAKKRSNCENPELYAVWPFRLYGLGKTGLEEARAAYANRGNHLDAGWGYDGNCAALLGLTDEAARILKIKCANSHPAYRWPATWGPNFDWLPDQNHGGNLLETTQLMLLQPQGDKIRLLPAWPQGWDVHFRLHAPRNTVVECAYRGGKIEKLQITPETRRKDVILPTFISPRN